MKVSGSEPPQLELACLGIQIKARGALAIVIVAILVIVRIGISALRSP